MSVTGSANRFLFVFLLLVPFLYGVSALDGNAQIVATTTTVKRVVTGDTLVVESGQTIRLIGITAPEPPRDGKTGGFYAEEARKTLETLLIGHSVEVWLENQNNMMRHKDKYGRQLAYLYILPSRKLLNAEMLRAGAGYFYSPHFIDAATKSYMLGAEYHAKKARVGVWSQTTESPEEIAKRQGRAYEEPPFVDAAPAAPAADAFPPIRTSQPSEAMKSIAKDDRSDAAVSTAPKLERETAYDNVHVESCGVLEVAPLGRLALIGVENVSGKAGDAARAEVVKLVQGKRLRFAYDDANAKQGHRDKDGNLLVYATLPDGASLNLQIVAKGIADADNTYDYAYKTPILTARDAARAREQGPRWRNDISRTIRLDRIREAVTGILNQEFGKVGGKVELVGENKDVLRVSHDLMDQRSANQIFQALTLAQTNSGVSALRLSGIREIQFTDVKVSKFFRFPL
jgi:micrococcal nuclease